MSNLNSEAYLRAKGYISGANVAKDLPCRECGYNLRGLEYGRKCPECRTIIERNKPVHAHIMDAPAPYLKKLRLGMGLICVGLWSPIIATIVALTIARDTSGGAFLATLILLAGPILFFLGGWIITRPKPHAVLLKRPLTHLANITRACLIITPLVTLASALNQLSSLEMILELLTTFCFFSELVLISYFFCDLARWAQDDVLARRFELILGSFALIGALDVIFRFFGSSFLELTCFAALILLATIIWFFVSVTVLFGTINRAVIDKPRHDDSIFRNPEKNF